jgi:adenylylsulfate kinase
MIDSSKKVVCKALSWRLVGIFLLGYITYIVTNKIEDVAIVSISFHILRTILYVLHERIWNRIKWGKTKGLFIQMTGLSGAGKTTLSNIVAKKLTNIGMKIEVIDGDEYRTELCHDLSFSKEDRNENIRRLGFVGKVLARNNVIAIMAAINPYEEIRNEIKQLGPFVKTVYIKCDMETLISRDPKGLYKRALLEDGNPDKITTFTGVSDPFESPLHTDLVINTTDESLEESASKLYKFIVKEANK